MRLGLVRMVLEKRSAISCFDDLCRYVSTVMVVLLEA